MKFKLDNDDAKKEYLTTQPQNVGQGQPVPGKKPHINIIFCIPGREFTANFLQSWTNLCNAMYQNGISFALSNAYSPVVYYARSACLRAHVLRGRHQKPFNGEYTYDYIMWIDSDIVFSPEHFFALLQKMQKNPEMQLLAGTYLMADGYHTTVVKDWDEDYFAEHGSFKFLTLEECQKALKDPSVPKDDGAFVGCYAGFGFLMIRNGIHEMFEYPFFRPQFHTLKEGTEGEIYDFSSEDASFFLDLREKGIKLHIDPSVHVGHEKHVVLR